MSQVLRRVAVLAVALLTAVGVSRAGEAPKEIRVDCAHYSPPSLALKPGPRSWYAEETRQ
ncbi:MAG: hypothetical protein NFW04_04725 [Candidatus Accumulibacter sp.]|uniref:hypothetical protein n=1 Tax=Accumulibacter sp. TaxID=2053492 RepID=UPI002600DFE4|nr:hypothetical protein [Accumulibacter sp.]MCM8597949.1 hypothetical protein [Accumulibacter sp.]MCM8661589.1 hypothetical protein [Accumulibacter sp.]HNC22280.1 hypothetical protein [Accumulibacter sp.]